MKTKLHLIVILCLYALNGAKAQTPYVAIPDANFRAHLEATYPSCMSGGMLDTTCSTIVNLSVLNVSNKSIEDLTGVRYFDALNSLYCSNNLLTSLPDLPSDMSFLSCSHNQLTSLPNLPATLKFLTCNDNQLTSLPALPLLIEEISCENNQLSVLPSLPASLIYLDCKSNQLNCLPTLPNDLEYIRAAGNSLVCLPNKPSGISTDISTVCNDGTGCGMLSGFNGKTSEESFINIYPNPSKGIFNISINSRIGELAKVQILNQYGSIVFTSEATDLSNTIAINLDNEQKGIYILMILQENKVIAKKLFLN